MSNKLSNYLDDSPGLRALAERLKHVRELQRLYNEIIPPHLAKTSRIGDVNEKNLIIIAFNGITAAGLKQRLPTLLARIQELGKKINAVRVEVQVEKFYTAVQHKGPRKLSSAGVACLDRLANVLPDSPLQQAVNRLAGRARSDQNQAFNDVKERDSGEQDDKKPE